MSKQELKASQDKMALYSGLLQDAFVEIYKKEKEQGRITSRFTRSQ